MSIPAGMFCFLQRNLFCRKIPTVGLLHFSGAPGACIPALIEEATVRHGE